jgi:CBS domain-containing protein
MKVRYIMTADVESCTLTTSVPQVAKLMWSAACGAIPVVDNKGVVVGIITDRDISMVLVSSNRKPSNIPAWEAMTSAVHACAPDDDVTTALETMRRFKVRRLPVLTEDGHLRGILSIDDIVMRALSPDAPTSTEILQTLRDIFEYRSRRPEAEILS